MELVRLYVAPGAPDSTKRSRAKTLRFWSLLRFAALSRRTTLQLSQYSSHVQSRKSTMSSTPFVLSGMSPNRCARNSSARTEVLLSI